MIYRFQRWRSSFVEKSCRISDSFFIVGATTWGARFRICEFPIIFLGESPNFRTGRPRGTPTMNDYPRASATLAMPWRVRYFRKIIKARAATKAPTKKYSVTA